jgi:hypothetical protein
MKKALAILCVALMSSSAIAATKCVPDGRGGICCWDTEKDGPFRPLSC